jgi:predicted NBD/HSP70 family sugar kinase
VEEKERRPGLGVRGQELIDSLTGSGPGTQAEIARRLEIAPSTVSRTIEHLNQANGDGAISKVPARDAQLPAGHLPRGGESAEVLMMGRAAGRVIGIEIGHGHLSVAVGDANGCLLGAPDSRFAWREHSIKQVQPHETFTRLARLVRGQLKKSDTGAEEIRAVAVSLPAPVGADGRVLSGKILRNYSGLQIGSELSTTLREAVGLDGDAPVFVENDVDALARGEHRYGEAFGRRDFAVLKCSSGIGAALLSDEVVVKGRGGGGVGEIGHCSIGPEMLSGGRGSVLAEPTECRCGVFGHLESYAGGDALLERFEPPAGRARRGSRRRRSPWTLDAFFKLAVEGREPYAPAIKDSAALIGIAANTVINLFNPEVVLICGKFSELGAPFLEEVRHECGSHGLLYGNPERLVRMGTGTSAEDRRRIGVRGAVTSALRKSETRLRIE